MSSASVQYSLSYDTLSDSTLVSKGVGSNVGCVNAVVDPPASPKNCEQSIVLPNFEHNSLSESENKRPLHFQGEKCFKEVLLDGFSILSFRTKDDLVSYVQRLEADQPQHQLDKASAVEKSKRSRRIGTTSSSATCKRRTKVGLYNHSHILSEDAAMDLLSVDNASESISGRVSANLHCGLQNGCLPNGVVHNSVHRTVNITTKPDSPLATTGSTTPSEHQSMRFSKSRQSDLCSSVSHTVSDLPTRNRYCDASGSRVPVAATMHSQRASPNDHCLFSPLAGSMLSTVADCHLTPLTTTWNNHTSHASHLPSGDRWLPPKSNHSDGSLLQMSPVSASAVSDVGPGTHFVTSTTSVTRPNPCHQFSVAALTKELVKQTVETSTVDPPRRPSTGVCPSVHSPTNLFFNQCQLTPRSSADLDSSQELARLSNSSSIVRTTYEGIPLSTPTAVCSHHSTASASYVSHNNLSCQLSNGMPSLCHQTQMKLDSHQSRGCPGKLPSTASQSGLLTNRSPSTSSPSISSPVQSRCRPSSATSKGISLSNMSTTKGSKISSSDRTTTTTTTPSASGTDFPNSRMLQQLMGIDAHTAERLFNDIRFTELYSLTMATLAGVEAKNNTSSCKPVLSNGLTDDKVANSDDWKTLRSNICSFTSGPGSVLSKSNVNSTGSCANGHSNSGSCSHASHLPSGDRWLPPKSNHSDGSLLQMSPVSASAVSDVGPGTHFVTSTTSVTRPNPCHQFSVAALTKELVKQTVETSTVDPPRRPSTGVCPSVHSPTNLFFNQCQLTPRSSADLDSSQELARLSNSSSIVRTTYEGIPLSTPTAVCSHHSTASASYVSHNNLSCQLSNGMPSLCHQTQMKLDSHQSRGCPGKLPSTASQSGLLTNRSPSTSSPSISSPVQSRCRPSSATSKGISLSNMSTTKGSKISSSDRTTTTTTTPSASGTDFPNSRMLQQLMGIDAHTAERLFNDIRFTELYSLTMATLAGVEAKNNTSSCKPVLSNGLTDDKVANSDDWKTLRSNILLKRTKATTVIPPCLLSKDRGSLSTVNALTRTQNLLHAAYSDRELINRITQLGHNNHHQTHSINNRSGQLPDNVPVNPFPMFPLPTGLPPPPPLTAGCPSSECVSDAYGPVRVAPASQRDPLHRVPPPPPLYTVNQQPGHSLPNMAAANTFVSPPPLAATPQMLGPRNRNQWESYFKRTLSAIHAGEFNPADRQDSDVHLGISANSIYPVPALTTRQSVVPHSALSVSTGPRPLVPSPQLAPHPHTSAITTQSNRLSARFGTVEQSKRHLGALYRPYHTGRLSAIHAGEFNPADRQDSDVHLGISANSIYPVPALTTRQSVVPHSALSVSTGPRPLVPSPQLAPHPHTSAITTQSNRLSARFGTVEQSKRHLGALYRPYHTGRVCGRWADAHVRIANYILLQKSLTGSQRTHKSTNSGPGVSLIPKFAPIRPIVRPLSMAPPRPMAVSWSSSGQSISNCFAHTVQTKTSAVNTNSSFDPRNLTIQLPTAPLFASADRMDEKREPPLHTPQMSNSQAPSKEILEMFWQSALQKWYSQSNLPLSGHFAPPPTSSSGNALHCLGLNPVNTKQSVSQLTADRRTATESSLAAMFPPSSLSSLPTSSFGSSLHLSLGSEAKRRRVEAPSTQHLLPPSHPELSVSHPMYSLPLLVRMPHPAELLTPGPHKQDILKATANLMNGYHIPEVFTNPQHIGLGYMNSDADRSNMLETGLKLASQSSHLATIHPW
ncbi:hypothetical protein AHF37_00704 [Paragonimus kellicotti]|nr:hypothetical protein AHF37_00704 [Paragonimus kellicotti]